MRKIFDAEFRELSYGMIDMVAAAGDAIDVITESLAPGDDAAAKPAAEMTRSMDQIEWDIENRCLRLPLQQQPVARDLRTISTAMKVVTDLQHIGDQCANITEISLLLKERKQARTLADICTMSQEAGVMAKHSIFAYVNQDTEAAQTVITLDDEVDVLFRTIKGELAELIAGDRDEAGQAIDLIIIVKCLERIADHTVSIAQWVIFCVAGETLGQGDAPMSKAIAVMEDDESICEMLRYYFQSVGYAVRAYKSGEVLFAGEEGLGLPAPYILDIMLPGMDGLEIFRRLRERRDTADVPVIMLIARSAEMDQVAGLENGADGYVVKPFGIMELQTRVKAVLRRTEHRGDRILTWGDVELDPAAREVHKVGKPVELTHKEFELLKLLFSRRGMALTWDEILRAIWDYDYTGKTHTVDMHVKALHQKLGEDIIVTVRGVGCKMV